MTDKRWTPIQSNIRKFMNMPEQELLTALGTPYAHEQSRSNKLLIYNIGDEVELSFEVQDGQVHRYTLKPRPHFHLDECDSGPHISWIPCPVLDKTTQDKRWLALQRNAPQYIGMPYNQLLNVLGIPDAQYSAGSMLAYHLSHDVDLHFDMRNNRVLSYSFNPHHAEEFFKVEPSVGPARK